MLRVSVHGLLLFGGLAFIDPQSREKGIIVTDHNYEAISKVTDNLFVIADGYTFPVESRDDLVRHGYLQPE